MSAEGQTAIGTSGLSSFGEQLGRLRRMHSVQLDVSEFHRAVGVEPAEGPGIRRPELRADLILEEARETAEALLGKRVHIHIENDPPADWGTGLPPKQSLIQVIDGLCDQLCVIYGTADECGIDLAPFWDEVHRSNMAKIPDCPNPDCREGFVFGIAGDAEFCACCDGTGKGAPIERADGKVLKPEGWTPPDIAGVLNHYYPSNRLEATI